MHGRRRDAGLRRRWTRSGSAVLLCVVVLHNINVVFNFRKYLKNREIVKDFFEEICNVSDKYSGRDVESRHLWHDDKKKQNMDFSFKVLFQKNNLFWWSGTDYVCVYFGTNVSAGKSLKLSLFFSFFSGPTLWWHLERAIIKTLFA